MPQALVGTGGFLAAILWIDLMFDVQAYGHSGTLPPDVLASIVGYYRRITTEAAPMGNLVGLVMILTVLGAVVQLSRGTLPLWLRVLALVTALVPTVTALALILPAARRLGLQQDDAARLSELALLVFRGHVVCLVVIVVFVGLQIAAVRQARPPASGGAVQ